MMNYCNPWQYITYTQEIPACQYEYKINILYQLFCSCFPYQKFALKCKIFEEVS